MFYFLDYKDAAFVKKLLGKALKDSARKEQAQRILNNMGKKEEDDRDWDCR